MPDYLLHLFNDPSCITSGEKEVLEQLPKRKTDLTGHKCVKVWVIHFEEGWNTVEIVLIFFVVMLVGSLIFGICWAVLKKGIQSAFTISAWWITAGGSSLALFALSSR
jgi:hypothetical protein